MATYADANRQLAKQMGVKIISLMADRNYGLRDFIVSDLDGFGVRLATPLNTTTPQQPPNSP